MSKVTQELKELNMPWQVAFTDTPKHPQVRFEEGKQTLDPMLMDLPPCIFLLRVIDVRMDVARQRPIATGRVRVRRLPVWTTRSAAFCTVQSRVAWMMTTPGD